ncbi:MAG: alpha/beta hydrolase [Oscillatoriales cyanobacterium RM1_1_9]|nr:alpha/beta hydrolase [Oscillatoriales cyanobacterium RM1_1_9]
MISPEGVQVPGLQSQQQWMRSLVQSPSFSYFWLNLVQPFASLLGQRKRVNRWLEYRRELFRSPGSCQLLYGRRWAEYQAELLNDQLPHLSRPLMILQGSEVEAIPQAQSEIYSQLAPLTQIHTVPLAGSNLPLEAPEATLEYIRDFTLGVSCSQVNSSYGSS